MAALEIFGLALCFGASIIFSIVSISGMDKENYYKFLAAIFWVASSVAYFIVFNAEASALVHLTWAWFGLALIFVVMGVYDFFKAKKEKRLSFEV